MLLEKSSPTLVQRVVGVGSPTAKQRSSADVPCEIVCRSGSIRTVGGPLLDQLNVSTINELHS